MCGVMWQWNNQLPGRSGVHDIANVRPKSINSVTAVRAGRGKPSLGADIARGFDHEVEAVQMHRMRT